MGHSSSSKSQSFQTPRAKVAYLGSARSGTGDNWTMRVTSAIFIPLSFALAYVFFLLAGKDFEAARQVVATPWVTIVLVASIAIGAHHMKIGMKSIILDYVHGEHCKEWSLIANSCFCYGAALVGIYAIARIAFG